MAVATAEEETPAPKKKKKLLVIVAAVALVVLLAAGVGIFLMMKHNKAAEGEADGEVAEATHDKKKETPPVYVKLEMFTTNLAMENPGDPQAAQYIQVAVELKVDDAPSGESLKLYMPEIRNAILRLLSSKKASELTSTEGKDTLADEIRDAVNSIAGSPGKKGAKPKGPVTTVLFSSFIIQ